MLLFDGIDAVKHLDVACAVNFLDTGDLVCEIVVLTIMCDGFYPEKCRVFVPAMGLPVLCYSAVMRTAKNPPKTSVFSSAV